MVRANYPGTFPTYKTLKDGTRRTYWYHRATGMRLDGEPGSREFLLSVAEAEKTLKARHTGDNFDGLIREYTASLEFTDKLSASTQREYRRMLAKAESEFGDMPREVLNDPAVRGDFLDWRAKVARASGEREADNRLSVISAMLTWARENGRIHANHIQGFKRLYHVDRSEIIWLPEHIHAFMRVAPIELQRALIMALHTGQRQGDLLVLPWSAYDGTAITLRQGKSARGRRVAPLVAIPCTQALRLMLDGMQRVSPLILTTKTGRALQKRYFARLWEEATIEAGLDRITLPGLAEPVSLHFHDLRGTAVTMLSEAGCQPQQIATITGHSLKTVTVILDRYLARTRALADQAIFNWENSPRTEFANRLQTSPPEPKAPKGKNHA
ncbi:integrase family protein [Methylobacterium sp. 4-46]|uniref:tyrosine-type recombinase/integrase n=1 Tax=unclassified Methylobacterium TaxID=2615210 RepID=UPI000152CDDC|nr:MULTISPECIES: tyrosine-type recombinase/integrase [Methylobacterium]ACA15702.1 integrase family protein [Methylobacterium sp. 4-46]WFT81439.1 tyrosine-type recombinase/integrase [Methylobacterium nodulans]